VGRSSSRQRLVIYGRGFRRRLRARRGWSDPPGEESQPVRACDRSGEPVLSSRGCLRPAILTDPKYLPLHAWASIPAGGSGEPRGAGSLDDSSRPWNRGRGSRLEGGLCFDHKRSPGEGAAGFYVYQTSAKDGKLERGRPQYPGPSGGTKGHAPASSVMLGRRTIRGRFVVKTIRPAGYHRESTNCPRTSMWRSAAGAGNGRGDGHRGASSSDDPRLTPDARRRNGSERPRWSCDVRARSEGRGGGRGGSFPDRLGEREGALPQWIAKRSASMLSWMRNVPPP